MAPWLTRAALGAAALAAAFGPAEALGHGAPQVPLDAKAIRGHHSSVSGIEPSLPGVSLRILGREDQLELENRSGKTIVVLGYEGEPYLRIAPGGVFRNARSRATYLNRHRFRGSRVPRYADPEAKPDWRRVSTEPLYAWHDQRIHWVEGAPPEGVRAEPSQRQKIFDWEVPIRVEGRELAIRGRLDYVPPGRESGPTLAIVLIVAGAGAGGLLLYVGRRAGRARSPAGPDVRTG